MTPLLRRIRHALLERGTFRRYLAYALGEMLLVVVGILIALQIDSWNDSRLDLIREREYLASMLSDIQINERRTEDAVNGNEILLDGLDRLLQRLSMPADQLLSDPLAQRATFLHALVYTYWYLRVDFSELTMAQLKSSGGLMLITDREVREAMLTYQQRLEQCKHQYEEMRIYFHTVEETQKRLFTMRLGKQSFEYIEEDFHHMLEPLEIYEPLVPQGVYLADDDPLLLNRYYGDVLMYRTALSNTNWFLRESIRLGSSLKNLIEAQYALQSEQ